MRRLSEAALHLRSLPEEAPEAFTLGPFADWTSKVNWLMARSIGSRTTQKVCWRPPLMAPLSPCAR